jgi:S1-C subfamily serine protease
VNRVRKIVKDIQDVGYAKYAGLGVNYDPRSTGMLQVPRFREQYAAEFGNEPPKTGILVSNVSPDSAAAKAGLKSWDVLLAIDGRTLNDPLVLSEVLNKKSPGDKVKLRYWSRGETKNVDVALMEIRAQ